MPDHDDELTRFCDAEHPRLVGLLTLHCGDRGLAEQLAQDALVRACQHWPRVRTMRHPRAWVTRVALNASTSWFRRRGAERRALRRHGRPDESVETDPATTLAVRGALARLPERERRALVLRYYGGFDVVETARALDCPVGTVKSLTHRARERLRTDLTIDREGEGVH